MKSAIDPVVTTFADETRRRLGAHLRELVLFGSRARGDARQTSDYDMLVVVDEKTSEIRNQLLDIEVEILTRYEVLVTLVAPQRTRMAAEPGAPPRQEHRARGRSALNHQLEQLLQKAEEKLRSLLSGKVVAYPS